MIPLPDWAPSLHPIVVHFPVALVVSAFVVDVVSIFLRGRGMGVATWLYAIGAVVLGAAYLSGRLGVEDVIIPARAESILADHEDWALRTLIFFSILGVVRIIVYRMRRLRNATLSWILAVAGFVGVGMLAITGDLGGRLVFGNGVGVTRQEGPSAAASVPETEGTAVANPEGFAWLPGAAGWSRLAAELDDFGTNVSENVIDVGVDSVLILNAASAPIMAVTRTPFGPVQIESEVNLDHFQGTFSLVYGAESADLYDYVAVESGSMSLGRSNPAGSPNMESEPVTVSGWTTLGGASDGHHFRGYVNGRLAVHGHGEPSAKAGVGFRIEGSGVILMRSIRVTPLR